MNIFSTQWARFIAAQLRRHRYPVAPVGSLGMDVTGPGGTVFIEVRSTTVLVHGSMEIPITTPEEVMDTLCGALLITIGVPSGG